MQSKFYKFIWYFFKEISFWNKKNSSTSEGRPSDPLTKFFAPGTHFIIGYNKFALYLYLLYPMMRCPIVHTICNVYACVHPTYLYQHMRVGRITGYMYALDRKSFHSCRRLFCSILPPTIICLRQIAILSIQILQNPPLAISPQVFRSKLTTLLFTYLNI